MKFKDYIGEMTVKIDGLRAKPIKKKYMGRKLARGMDMRNMGEYFAEKPDGGWEEIPASLIEGVADKHQLKILKDTVRNPMKGKFLGGPSAEEAKATLKSQFGWTDAQIKKLEEDTGEMIDAFGSDRQKKKFKKYGSSDAPPKKQTSSEKRKKSEYDKKRKKKSQGPMPY